MNLFYYMFEKLLIVLLGLFILSLMSSKRFFYGIKEAKVD